MKKRVMLGIGAVLLAVSVLLVVWQGSFNTSNFAPANPNQTFIFWAVSLLIFLLMVTLGFILFRDLVKLYIARQSNRVGSRIQTKLVIGALALSCLPVFCLVLFSFEVLSHSVNRWFMNPVENQVSVFVEAATLLRKEMGDEVKAQAMVLAMRPEVRQALAGGGLPPTFLQDFAKAQEAQYAAVFQRDGSTVMASWLQPDASKRAADPVPARVPVLDTGGGLLGYVELASPLPIDVKAKVAAIEADNAKYQDIKSGMRQAKFFYTQLMILITVFVLFFTTWVALFLAKQISVPITALLEAAREVRTGNLHYRVNVRAIDELALLVNGFNQMTAELESSSGELDLRRRFTEAILESIPTGVISIGADGSIHRVNRALSKIFPAETVARATRLEDLFSREDTAEIKYMMKRARRTGAASSQMELRTASKKLQLSVTVSALEEKLTSGFVVVLEDTSELLRAQKAAAWHEVARRVAHEIKNPLTPIALSAERIERQVERLVLPAATGHILRECTTTIAKSVESVKTLVDEFSQFARFPTAQPVRCDLNEVVAEALQVFQHRLEGIDMHTSFGAGLPPVNVDRDQFHRVVINLVDNAAEAMQDALVKELHITTQTGTAETVELVVADSGCGVGPDEKEKLFLPYFSTKNRGTGLGLAIVSHIVAEHNATIRVEDNQPVGARFIVDVPAAAESKDTEEMKEVEEVREQA
jgi:two-component system, NtrC family, nitrogen regulation sensor histidine kinase NtrY